MFHEPTQKFLRVPILEPGLIISKMIERVVHDQTNRFHLESNILYNRQSVISDKIFGKK